MSSRIIGKTDITAIGLAVAEIVQKWSVCKGVNNPVFGD